MGKRELRSTQAQAKRPAPDQNEREHIHVRGSKRADVLLQKVSLRYAIVKDKPVSVKRKLGQIYQMKEAKVSTARVMAKVEKVAEKKDKHRVDNAIQKVRGVDLTAEVSGRMTYGRIGKTIYMGLIVQELTARSVDLSGTEGSGVKALIKLLKENEDNTKTFEPKTDLWGALAKLQDSN